MAWFALATSLGFARASAGADAATELARGDEFYARGRLTDAQPAYAAALAARPGDYEALCRLARTESELVETTTGDAQKRWIAASVTHARAAVAAARDSAGGHVWLAAALGRQALHEGARTRLRMAYEIKAQVDTALALDPANSRAYHIRGMWNRSLASLSGFEKALANAILGGVPPGATMENALRDMQKAVDLAPDYVHHHYELGRTLHMLHRDADARRELEKALALPPTSDALDPKYQAQAREYLKKLN